MSWGDYFCAPGGPRRCSRTPPTVSWSTGGGGRTCGRPSRRQHHRRPRSRAEPPADDDSWVTTAPTRWYRRPRPGAKMFPSLPDQLRLTRSAFARTTSVLPSPSPKPEPGPAAPSSSTRLSVIFPIACLPVWVLAAHDRLSSPACVPEAGCPVTRRTDPGHSPAAGRTATLNQPADTCRTCRCERATCWGYRLVATRCGRARR